MFAPKQKTDKSALIVKIQDIVIISFASTKAAKEGPNWREIKMWACGCGLSASTSPNISPSPLRIRHQRLKQGGCNGGLHCFPPLTPSSPHPYPVSSFSASPLPFLLCSRRRHKVCSSQDLPFFSLPLFAKFVPIYRWLITSCSCWK
jgi:hypothetical protein